MGLLSRSLRDRRALLGGAAYLLVVLVVASCTSAPQRFPHPKHLAKPYMGCGMCHETGGAKATYPDAQRCSMCHEDAADKESIAHKPLPPEPLPASFKDVLFEHGRHEKKGLACKECHVEVHGAESDRTALFPSMEACQTCHRAKGVPAECTTCHAKLAPGYVPQDHKVLWSERHGGASKIPRSRCESCHDRDQFCVRCHEHERPRDHVLGWKLRDHGLSANVDRAKCATCHRADQCARCHERNAPSTHGSPSWKWGGHKPDARWNLRSCAVCHVSGPVPCGPCHPSPF